jgi:hypothetical protein
MSTDSDNINELEDEATLDKIRHFKGSFQDLKKQYNDPTPDLSKELSNRYGNRKPVMGKTPMVNPLNQQKKGGAVKRKKK